MMSVIPSAKAASTTLFGLEMRKLSVLVRDTKKTYHIIMVSNSYDVQTNESQVAV